MEISRDGLRTNEQVLNFGLAKGNLFEPPTYPLSRNNAGVIFHFGQKDFFTELSQRGDTLYARSYGPYEAQGGFVVLGWQQSEAASLPFPTQIGVDVLRVYPGNTQSSTKSFEIGRPARSLDLWLPLQPWEMSDLIGKATSNALYTTVRSSIQEPFDKDGWQNILDRFSTDMSADAKVAIQMGIAHSVID